MGLAGRAVNDPGETAVAGAAFAQSVARMLAPANEPLSPLMHGRSLSVRVAVLQVPFRPLKAAAKKVGATLNDTYMAAVAGALAAYHEAHNAPAEYVRVNMPINMRLAGEFLVRQRLGACALPDADRQRRRRPRIKRLSPILQQARQRTGPGRQRHGVPVAHRPAAECRHLGVGRDDEGLRPGHHQRPRPADRPVRGRCRGRVDRPVRAQGWRCGQRRPDDLQRHGLHRDQHRHPRHPGPGCVHRLPGQGVRRGPGDR